MYAPPMSIKVLVLDDHPVVKSGIDHAVSKHEISVIGFITQTDQLLEAYRQHQPDVVVLEVRIGGKDSLNVVERLQEEFPSSKVIAFSSQTNATYIARAAALGCFEYILKSAECDALIQAIERAANGDPTPDHSLLVTTSTRMRRTSSRTANSPLTKREMQVLQHVAMGLSNREVGKSLGISVETVKEHVQNILRKLDVNDRTQAAVWAVKQGFV